jgi:hypothetical protein
VQKIEITFYILSDHNGIKLETNGKWNYRKYANTWGLSNILNDQWIIKIMGRSEYPEIKWKHKL